MKNILVPTDFSPNAHAAAIYAALLARRVQARLVLFHALPVCAQTEDDLDPETKAQASLDALAFELHSLYQVSITRLMRPGFAADEIPLMADKIKPALIVMGASGENQQADGTMGAISAEILQNHAYPVICIPPDLSVNLRNSLPALEAIPVSYYTARGAKHLQELLAVDIAEDIRGT